MLLLWYRTMKDDGYFDHDGEEHQLAKYLETGVYP